MAKAKKKIAGRIGKTNPDRYEQASFFMSALNCELESCVKYYFEGKFDEFEFQQIFQELCDVAAFNIAEVKEI